MKLAVSLILMTIGLIEIFRFASPKRPTLNWDFSNDHSLNVIGGWPANTPGPVMHTASQPLTIKTENREPKTIDELIVGAWVYRTGKNVKSVQCDTACDSMDDALAIAGEWAKEYGVTNPQQSLDEFAEYVRTHHKSVYEWKGTGSDMELSICGAAPTHCLWYFGRTFIVTPTRSGE